ncbi:cysteine hydrolase family protein [Actinoplanes derwentensis]|uniref:Nicotinamidase-related amidase n=1 Tax=Actinoplanes derwentensis TaxID=113562 RepID=A0A1H1T7F7_9ACTN|nr:isochorismatase family cysteine hydrolase [Actinoplanes derwentensis]GID89008.1 cysteine hydrolase [Actinoplanes derwentensis]SDS56175.1 Nicotinamidase-related amidase [Actinoplanes derwentensis]
MTRSALLVMDVQLAVTARYPDPDYLPRLATAVDAARTAGLPVIYVVVGFRPGAPEVDPRNRMFGAIAGRDTPAQAAEVHPAVAPRPDEAIVVKRRVSGFAGSDLDMLLRASGIDHLVLTGIATSGVVLSTLRQAADLDYELTVLSDGCLDNDPEVHDVLTGKVFPMQADVTTVDKWIGDTLTNHD